MGDGSDPAGFGPELAAVQACMPEHILFLDASEAVLRARKAGDATVPGNSLRIT